MLKMIMLNSYIIYDIFITVKKAYYKLSLKVHPDKVSDDEKEIATEKFQLLSRLYQILSDTKRRKVYDKTGQVLTRIFSFKSRV